MVDNEIPDDAEYPKNVFTRNKSPFLHIFETKNLQESKRTKWDFTNVLKTAGFIFFTCMDYS